MAHIRIVHFMIIVIVVLTIFLYSLLYTASPEMNTIVHAGTAHHYVMNGKDIRDSDRVSSKNILQNGDILVSRSSSDSNNEGVGGLVGDGDSVVPSLENNHIDDDVLQETQKDGVGTVVIRSENIVDTSAIAKSNISLTSVNASVSNNISNSNSQAAAAASSVLPTLEAKSTAKISDKSSVKKLTNSSQSASTTTTTTTVSTAKSNNDGVALRNVTQPNNSNSKKQSNETVAKVVRTNEIYQPGFTDSSADLCRNGGEQLRLLILIMSAPTHHEQRLAIRQSWGHYGSRRDVAIGFILGQTENQAHEDALAAEQYMYNDLVRGHFVDSYNNLTLKTISSLEWVDTYCPNVSFFLKTDDDMFINIPRLLQFIEKHHNDKRTIYGRLAKKWKPIRNKKSKYYVSPQQYFPTIFPHFTTGPAYLITSDVIGDLYRKSLNQTYLKLEDVYTTGIVAQLLNIKRVHVTEFLNRRIAFNQCNIKKAISLHMIKPIEQFDLWKKLLDNSVKCK